jgi:hypothetical protein
MGWLSHKSRAADEGDLEQLRVLYASLGPGFPAQAQRVFDGDGAGGDGSWCFAYNGRRLRCLAAPELSNYELFALPPDWELMHVVVSSLTGRLTSRGELLNAIGYLYCRPRGSWESVRLPFMHLWTMCAGRALRYESILDGIELRRAQRLEGCPAA